jgi:hypothetical protein
MFRNSRLITYVANWLGYIVLPLPISVVSSIVIDAVDCALNPKLNTKSEQYHKTDKKYDLITRLIQTIIIKDKLLTGLFAFRSVGEIAYLSGLVSRKILAFTPDFFQVRLLQIVFNLSKPTTYIMYILKFIIEIYFHVMKRTFSQLFGNFSGWGCLRYNLKNERYITRRRPSIKCRRTMNKVASGNILY